MDSQASDSGKKDNTYKILRIRTKIENGYNGIWTHIPNIDELAEALGRPAPYVAMYMAYAAQVLPMYDYATGSFKLLGVHIASELARSVDEFIKKFIECYRCGHPETHLVITESLRIHLECDRCCFISEVDMTEELAEFIISSHLKPKGQEPARILETEREKKNL